MTDNEAIEASAVVFDRCLTCEHRSLNESSRLCSRMGTETRPPGTNYSRLYACSRVCEFRNGLTQSHAELLQVAKRMAREDASLCPLYSRGDPS